MILLVPANPRHLRSLLHSPQQPYVCAQSKPTSTYIIPTLTSSYHIPPNTNQTSTITTLLIAPASLLPCPRRGPSPVMLFAWPAVPAPKWMRGQPVFIDERNKTLRLTVRPKMDSFATCRYIWGGRCASSGEFFFTHVCVCVCAQNVCVLLIISRVC